MISLIMEFALFFLVLFVALPVLLVAVMIVRENVQHRRHPQWHEDETGKMVS